MPAFDRRDLSDRPGIPLPLPALLAVLCVGSLGYEFGSGRIGLYIVASFFMVFAIAVAALFVRIRQSDAARRLVVAGACSLAMCLVVCGSLVGQRGSIDILVNTPVSSMEFELASDPKSTTSGWRATAIVRIDGVEAGRVWLTTKERCERGALVTGYGSLTVPDGEFAAFLSRKGIVARVSMPYLKDVAWSEGTYGIVSRIRAYVVSRIAPETGDGRALIAGSVTGTTATMNDSGLSDDFSATGLSHLVAVSAGHLVVVMALANKVLERFRLGPAFRAVVLIAVTGAYVLLCGEPKSAVRAWVMGAANLLAQVSGRRSHGATSCSWCGIGMCLLDPYAVSDLGLLLSLACVLSMGLFLPLVRRTLRDVELPALPAALPRARRRKLYRKADDALALLGTSVVCSVASAPVCAAYFGTVSLVAPIVNLLVAPLFEPFIALGFVATLMCWVPVASDAILWVAGMYGDALAALVGVLARVPYASVEVELPEWASLAVPIVLGAALYAAWPRFDLRRLGIGVCACVAALSCVAVLKTFVADAQVTMLDIGQGDAILVRRGSACVLVDTGPADDGIVAKLAALGVRRLEAVVVTHAHADHEGSLEDVLEGLDVGMVVVAEGSEATYLELFGEALDGRLETVHAEDAFSCAGFTFEVVWPTEPVAGDENEDSICAYVTYETATSETTFLLTGDAEADVLEALRARGFARDVDVLKVGHHGSKAALTEELVAAYAPEAAIVSAGEGNSYGHPSAECVSLLEDAGCAVFCTIESGTIEVAPSRDGVRVTCGI